MKNLDILIFRSVLLTLFVFIFWNSAGYILFGISLVLVLVNLIKTRFLLLSKNWFLFFSLNLFLVYFFNEIIFGDIFRKIHFWFWLALPLVLCSFEFTQKRKKQLFTAINLGGFIMVLIALAGAFFVKKELSIYTFRDESILRQHQTIYSVFLIVNIFTSLRLLSKQSLFYCKILYILNGFFSVVMLFMIKSRMPLITFLFIVSAYIFYGIFIQRINKFKLITVFFISILGCIYVGMTMQHGDRISVTLDTQKNERIFIYKAVLDTYIQEHFNPITGYHTELQSGPILQKSILNQKNILKKQGIPIPELLEGLRTHNDFFEHFLNYGLIGLSLFISLFFTMFKKAIVKRDFNLLACGLLLFLTCLTDNLFLMQASLFMYLSLGTLLYRNVQDAK